MRFLIASMLFVSLSLPLLGCASSGSTAPQARVASSQQSAPPDKEPDDRSSVDRHHHMDR